jgi:hypothetical protein
MRHSELGEPSRHLFTQRRGLLGACFRQMPRDFEVRFLHLLDAFSQRLQGFVAAIKVGDALLKCGESRCKLGIGHVMPARKRTNFSEPVVQPLETVGVRFNALAIVTQIGRKLPQLDFDSREPVGRIAQQRIVVDELAQCVFGMHHERVGRATFILIELG